MCFFHSLFCKYRILSFIAQAARQLTGDDLKLLVAAKEKEDKEKAEAKAQEDKEEEKDKEDEAK